MTDQDRVKKIAGIVTNPNNFQSLFSIWLRLSKDGIVRRDDTYTFGQLSTWFFHEIITKDIPDWVPEYNQVINQVLFISSMN
jgi:hypothetical protein